MHMCTVNSYASHARTLNNIIYYNHYFIGVPWYQIKREQKLTRVHRPEGAITRSPAAFPISPKTRLTRLSLYFLNYSYRSVKKIILLNYDEKKWKKRVTHNNM